MFQDDYTRVMITLVYGAADQKHNQAEVLKQFLEEQLDRHAS